MKLLQIIATAQGGRLVHQLADVYAIDPALAARIVKLFLPAITKAIARRAETPEGVVALLQFLGAERYDDALTRPDIFRDTRLAEEGRYILHALFAHAAQIDRIVGNRAAELPVPPALLADMFGHIALAAIGALQQRTRAPLAQMLGDLAEGFADHRALANPYLALAAEVEARMGRERGGGKRKMAGVFGSLFGGKERAA